MVGAHVPRLEHGRPLRVVGVCVVHVRLGRRLLTQAAVTTCGVANKHSRAIAVQVSAPSLFPALSDPFPRAKRQSLSITRRISYTYLAAPHPSPGRLGIRSEQRPSLRIAPPPRRRGGRPWYPRVHPYAMSITCKPAHRRETISSEYDFLQSGAAADLDKLPESSACSRDNVTPSSAASSRSSSTLIKPSPFRSRTLDLFKSALAIGVRARAFLASP